MTPKSGDLRSHRARAAALELARGAASVLALVSVLYVAFLLPSRLKTERIREQRDALAAEVKDLERETRTLGEEARALENDPYVVERALRTRLGFLRPGERVVVVSR